MDHKDLDVWKKSMEFVTIAYSESAKFPDIEKFGIISQIRKAAVSIPTNIAEGAARNYDKEFIQFLYISLGSLSELETLFLLSKELGYINQTDVETFLNDLIKIKKLILGLIKYFKTKKQNFSHISIHDSP